MMSKKALLISIILLTASGLAADVPFVFGDGSHDIAGLSSVQLEEESSASSDLAGVPPVFYPSGGVLMQIPVVGGGSAGQGETEMQAAYLERAVRARVEPSHPTVRDMALLLVAKYPGDLTIDQICSIYGYMKKGNGSVNGWSYARDPRGSDYFMYANHSLDIGSKAGCAGVGDCDDFAILMASLVESIGGTTRIIFVQNRTTGGHAYAEVYLGNLGDQNSQVDPIINWLKKRYHTDRIYTHIDTISKCVWLNLDWGADESGKTHPGGPFYQGEKHLLVFIGSSENASLKLPETEENRAEISPALPLNITADEMESRSAEVWFNKGFAYSSLGRYEEAISSYEQAIRIDPQLAEAWNNKGIALSNLGRHKEAIKAYEAAIKLERGFSAAWYNKGLSLDALGRNAEAIEAYDKALKMDPQNARVWINKANDLNILGRYDEALQACGRAIAIQPNDVNAWDNKAWALGGLGRYEETIAACEKAIELNPDDKIAWNNMAAALMGLEKYSDALDACRMAIKLDPQYENALVNEDRALQALGHTTGANAVFAREMQLGF
ncbi:MAG: tetratricopeptide repeat protein [Methanothrix sp.]|nr:tetratricopeptide repeat protein [Methanothrix sp.]